MTPPPTDLDPVQEVSSPRDIRPDIPLPRGDLPPALLAVIAFVLALALFLYLNARRLSTRDEASSARVLALPAPPPPLDIPAAAPVLVRAPAVVLPAPSAPAAAPAPRATPVVPAVPIGDPLMSVAALPEEPPRTSGAAMVIDLTAGGAIGGAAGVGGADPGTAAIASDTDAARATLIRNRSSLIAQGTIVSAVLETPLNSDRPGIARALVSRDARGFDGSRILIPRGSRLVGEFRADVSPGQRRIQVIWTRLIRPDGVAMRIGSPAVDALGGIGIAGRVNTHFLERFTSAVLQSALTIGVNVASQAGGPPNSVYVGLPSQVGQLGQQLTPSSNRAATIKVREGAQIAIIVARDLDFSGTIPVR